MSRNREGTMTKSTRVLVSGYGGFLGSAICRQLIHEGFQVVGLARKSYPSLASIGVQTIQGDAADRETVQSLVSRCDAVIHTAAIAGVGGHPSDYEHANVTTTQVLLKASIEAKVGAFVFCSSPSVVFAGRSQCNIDESEPYPERYLADYPRTKAIAEQMVLAASNELPVCSLRPHLIWGKGDNHLTPRLVDRARRGRLRVVGDGRNIIDTVHVDYAADAHVKALKVLLKNPTSTNGRAFFITDGQPIGCWDWIDLILRQFGLSKPNKSISVVAAYRLGYALELIYKSLRLRGEPPMTRFVALQMGLDHYYNIDAARSLLGYEPIGDRQTKILEINQTN